MADDTVPSLRERVSGIMGGISSRFSGFYLLERAFQGLACQVQFIGLLQVQPQAGAGAEPFAEAERGIR